MQSRIRIGYWNRSCREPLYYPHDSHLILIAPAGMGKFRDVLAQLGMCRGAGPLGLLRGGASMIWVDPKLQAAAVLSRHLALKLGHEVGVMNPFGILSRFLKSCKPAQFNPMASLLPSSLSYGADCEGQSEAIVVDETRGTEGSHWSLSARDLVAGLIAAFGKYAPPHQKHLVAVREIICSHGLFAFCRSMVERGDAFIVQKLGRFAATGAEENKEVLGIISTAITQSSFIGNQAISENLKASTFSFRDLKKRPTTLFLGLPARYLSPCSKWFRLVIASALNELLQEERGVPVLLVLDEFAQLGHLKVIENAMALARGYGVQLLPVLQDLNQLRGAYHESHETFLANAGCRIFLATQDKFTSEYVSSMCGDTEVRAASRSFNGGLEGSGVNVGLHSRRYLLPHEVRELPGDEMLVFAQGIPGVIRAGRRPYYRSPEFEGLYDPDPYHLPDGYDEGSEG